MINNLIENSFMRCVCSCVALSLSHSHIHTVRHTGRVPPAPLMTWTLNTYLWTSFVVTVQVWRRAASWQECVQMAVRKALVEFTAMKVSFFSVVHRHLLRCSVFLVLQDTLCRNNILMLLGIWKIPERHRTAATFIIDKTWLCNPVTIPTHTYPSIRTTN